METAMGPFKPHEDKFLTKYQNQIQNIIKKDLEKWLSVHLKL